MKCEEVYVGNTNLFHDVSCQAEVSSQLKDHGIMLDIMGPTGQSLKLNSSQGVTFWVLPLDNISC